MRSLFSKLSLSKLFRTLSTSTGDTRAHKSRSVSIEGLESRNLFSAGGIDPGFAPSNVSPVQISSFTSLSLPGEREFFTVNNTHDSGPGSLRRAINEANKTLESTIEFHIHERFEQNGVFVIKPRHQLPALKSMTTVDGSTQVASTGDTNGGRPVVFIDGSRGRATNGLTLLGDSESVNDLGINNFKRGDGILVEDAAAADAPKSTKDLGINIFKQGGAALVEVAAAADDSIYNCLIGTDSSGSKAAPNKNGVAVVGGASNTLIGAAGKRNILSGNLEAGVDLIDAQGAVVQGNWIGLDSTGTSAVGNGSGVFLYGYSKGNTIGGSASAGTANAISGNGIGIQTTYVVYPDTVISDNNVEENILGFDAGGSNSIPNTGGNVVHTSPFQTIW